MNIHQPEDSQSTPTASGPTTESLATGGLLTNAGSSVAAGQAVGQLEQDPTVISQRPMAMPAEFVRSLSLVELAKSLEGRSLHHFSVERMIGGGGMGAVFRGRDQRLDREVAIKVIPESRRDPETLRRFRMEAQSAARLDHPNIARVYDIGEDETWNYIVFEYIEGINLRDLVLSGGPMSIDDAVFTTRQVAEALQHAHQRDVVHRDIKPSNVIITPTGMAKVVDMGLARNTAMDRSTADQTASGVTLGTFDYISPEQARDPRDADVRSDLYSLGCTLFYLLTGQPPFPEGTALQKLLNHGSQPPPDPRQWREDISDQLAAVLSKLMAKRPADRYQKPIELINDLLLIAQIEQLPRSRSAGTILLRPTIARRSLLETHLPWLVPLCVLVGSVIWLQSAESLTPPLDIPQPTLTSAQSWRIPTAPPNPAPPLPSALRDPSLSSVSPEEQAAPQPNLPANRPSPTVELIGSRPQMPSKQSTLADPKNIGPAIQSDTIARASASPQDNSPPAVASASDVDARGPANPQSRTPDPISEASTPTASTAAPNPVDAAVGTSSTVELTSASPTLEPTRGLAANQAAGPATNQPLHDQPVNNMPADVIRVGGSATESLGNLARWAPNLPAALMQAAMQSDIRVIELHESLELTSPIALPRSGLTLRAAPGVQAEIVLTGADAFGPGWEAWIDVDRKQLRCQGLRIVCRNDMRQPQAVFSLRNGGRIELEDCQVTMLASRDSQLGSCILIKESPRSGSSLNGPILSTSSATSTTLMPTTSPTTVMPSIMPNIMPNIMPGATEEGEEDVAAVAATAPNIDDPPVAIALRSSVVRGAQSLITMRNITRAEITIEKLCAILEGRVMTIRQTEPERVPPVIRMNLQQSTFVTNLGFLALIATASDRPPFTLMRTAKLCVFWSPVAVPHISIDGLDSERSLEKVLLLRGEENAYDSSLDTLCNCRLNDGQVLEVSLLGATQEWFKELGNELELRWREPIPPEQPMHEQLPTQYRLRDSMFMPGYTR